MTDDRKPTTIPLHFRDRIYRVVSGIALVCEIEDELGGIAELAARLKSGRWTAGEVVTLTHILLGAAGHAADWVELGDRMVAEGLAECADAALVVLNKILEGRGGRIKIFKLNQEGATPLTPTLSHPRPLGAGGEGEEGEEGDF